MDLGDCRHSCLKSHAPEDEKKIKALRPIHISHFLCVYSSRYSINWILLLAVDVDTAPALEQLNSIPAQTEDSARTHLHLSSANARPSTLEVSVSSLTSATKHSAATEEHASTPWPMRSVFA